MGPLRGQRGRTRGGRPCHGPCPALRRAPAPCGWHLEAGQTPRAEAGVPRPLSEPIPLPAFLGGRGGASDVGDVGESVLVETKIWLVKAP